MGADGAAGGGGGGAAFRFMATEAAKDTHRRGLESDAGDDAAASAFAFFMALTFPNVLGTAEAVPLQLRFMEWHRSGRFRTK